MPGRVTASCCIVAVLTLLGTAATPAATGLGAAHAEHYAYSRLHVVTPNGVRHRLDFVAGIADDGEVVGDADTPKGLGSHACILSAQGHVTMIRARHHRWTEATAVSSNGTIAFQVVHPRSEATSTYLRDPNGKRHRVRAPGLDPYTSFVAGVNNQHDMLWLGFTHDGRSRSILQRNGHHRTLRVAGASAGSTAAVGINDHGTIVGSFADSHNVTHGFIDRHGHVQVIDLPKAGTHPYRGSQIQAIADNGDWVGAATLDDENATSISYVHRGGHHVQKIEFPNTDLQTLVADINDAGEIVGDLTATDRRHQGFIAKPER
jgi:hypothetical protein